MQLVAPAGNFNSLRAAVKNGADAVYLGMPQFSARAKAENFDTQALLSAIKFAHSYGVKVFVTLNTLIKDGEMHTALDAATLAYESGADAAIVQDIRFIRELKRILPDFTLHASTQMGIHNADGAMALLDMGIRRAVLSRETLPQDIEKIKKTGIDIEFFVQGALCVCFSGNCYFSSMASSYSGNRGKCMQLCRKPYTLGGRTGYHLSAKDLCLYKKLDYLRSLGVSAIKIEGRMRSEEYVAQAVRIYKSQMPPEDAVKGLEEVFNRGNYCAAYLDEDAQFNVIYSKSQANIGAFIGNISSLHGKTVVVDGFTPHAADGYKIMRDGMELGGGRVQGGVIATDCACRIGDEVRRTFDGRLSERLKLSEKLIPVKVSVAAYVGSPLRATASAMGVEVEVIGDEVASVATTRGLCDGDINKSFMRVGDLPFAPEIDIKNNGNAFLPISKLNDFRRNVYASLYDKLASRLPQRSSQPAFCLDYNKFTGHGTIIMVDDTAVLNDKIVAAADYIALSPRDYSDVSHMRLDFAKPILLDLPIAMRGDDRDILINAINNENIFGVISNNYYTLKLTNKPILLGTGHNIIGNCDYPHITSFEADEINNGFAYVYGSVPVMTLCHCPYGKCKNCSGRDILIDEKGRKFAMRRYKLAHCYWRLYNCVPVNLLADSTKKYGDKLFDFTGLDSAEILNILNGKFSREFTRGNMNKGLK